MVAASKDSKKNDETTESTKAKRGAPKGPRIPTVERLRLELEAAEAKARENAGKKVAKLEDEHEKAKLDLARATARVEKAEAALRQGKVDAGIDVEGDEGVVGDAERISEALDTNDAYASSDDQTVTV